MRKSVLPRAAWAYWAILWGQQLLLCAVRATMISRRWWRIALLLPIGAPLITIFVARFLCLACYRLPFSGWRTTCCGGVQGIVFIKLSHCVILGASLPDLFCLSMVKRT